MNFRNILGVMIYGLTLTAFAAGEGEASAEDDYIAWATEIWESIDRKTGTIKIGEANAVLTVPESFYYLDSEESEKVLVDMWGNPPGQTILGMLFPSDTTPFDGNSWAVTIEYEEDGYVSDSNADEIDYSDLLSQMKDDTLAYNNDRIENGYESIELIGWAADPYYDSNEKKLHWAKEIKFGQQDINTLNYNIRILGRKGVLVLNFISGMDQKATIDASIEDVLAMAEFDQGSKYSDFDPNLDKVATYGLGALIAGKVIAKTGFFVVALVFLKKFGVIIFIALAALFKNIFSRRTKKMD